ncbi:hypothetical protein DIPPA_18639 [Diplonema papillatum]|nr:hypothetical protein DIPPA_18639 [Diplonema papillatum]
MSKLFLQAQRPVSRLQRQLRGKTDNFGSWSTGFPMQDVTGGYRDGYMRNQNMWRWEENWWKDQESHITVLYRKSEMRHGFAGEEIVLPRRQAEDALEKGVAVLPNEENEHVLPVWNPETNVFDRYLERTPALLAEIARKRQWIDLYWRVHDSYLEVHRQVTGWNFMLSTPIGKTELARHLWQQAQVRINPEWIHFRYTAPQGIRDLGHTWAWLMLPGGRDIAAPRLVYHNDRVKIRIQIKHDRSAAF